MKNDLPRADRANSGAAHAANRRTVLKAAGAAVLATTAGVAGARGTAWAGHARAAGGAYDAIIVGAGFAGVTAARELKAKGLKVLILEARDRIGGRTWTSTLAGTSIELGGEAVDPKQPNIWAEVQRYDIPLSTGGGIDNFVLAKGDGFAAVPPSDASAKLKTLYNAYFEGVQQYFPQPSDPLAHASLLTGIDKLSMQDRLDQVGFTGDDLKWFNGATAGLSGGSSRRGAYTMFAQSWALSGFTYDGYQSINTYSPTNGTVALLQAILNDAAADLRLSCPVTRISDDGGKVTVTTKAGQSYTAPHVVVAVPVNVWKTITFSPGLPAAYTNLSQAGVGAPNVKKFYLRVKNSSAGAFVASPPEGFPMSTVVPQTTLSDGSLLMFAFCQDPTLDTANAGAVQKVMQKLVPGIQVLATKSQSWYTDPYSLGGWACRRPGMLTGPYRTVQQPVGRIAFATSDIANGWSGYIDGAVESGITAAKQIATLTAR